MTAYEIWDQMNHFVIDTKINRAVGNVVRKLQCENGEDEAINYIKAFFECDDDTAKDAFEIFKEKMGEPPSQQQIARVNAVARESLNKPKCPTCGSANVKKISGTAKVAGAAMFGLFSKTARSQFKCENCGYKW